MLTAKMVETIEKNILCKVTNRYGNAEFGVIAHAKSDDHYNKLKVFQNAFYVENCESSNLIVTNLTNYGFPLLRYDTGDVATVRRESDGCFIYDIQGRIHDAVEIGEKTYPTHYIMDFLDHEVRRVREFQIVLSDQNPLPCLNIVAEDENDKDRILKAVQARWPSGLVTQFISYEELVRQGWRQKFRHMIDLRGK
jgi:phenylacetate-CoA ligase